MKLIAVIMTLCVLQVSAAGYAQKLTLKRQKATLEDVFEQVNVQTGYKILCDADLIKASRAREVDFKNVGIQQVLHTYFPEKNFAITLKNKTIVIKQNPVSKPITAHIILPPPVELTGTVSDSSTGELLSGVTVQIKGSNRGTTTDVDGKFSLSVPDDAVLVISYIGYRKKEIRVNGRSSINIKLATGISSLSQLVVVGYGTQKREDLTGSVGSLSAKDFNQGISLAPAQLMEGKIAGVHIVQSSGKPGAASAVHIRGVTSISAGNSPLYVIDGVPIQTATANSYIDMGGTTSPFNSMPSNPLNIINPADIKSITVLKDASAEAIYGSRGANGVIIITTKNATPGLAYNGYVGIATIPKKLPFLSRDEYVNYAESNNLAYPDKSANTNWQDEIFRKAIVHNHNLAFGGTSENTNYRISLGYTGQEGIIIGSNLHKYTGRFNISHHALNNKLTLTLHLTEARVDQNQAPISATVNDAGGNILKDALRWAPTLPVKNPDGSYYQIGALRVNPVSWTQLTDQSQRNTTLGDAKIDYDITNWLKATVNFGYTNEFINRNIYVPASNPVGANQNGRAAISKVQNENFLLETYFTYDNNITTNSHLNFVAGYSFQRFIITSSYQAASQFPSDATKWNLMQSAGNIITNTTNLSANRLISFYGRANYSLMDRYLLTLTLRDDGSSRFGENNRFGLFPSGALAWVISKEPFFHTGFFNNLKLRMGYGVTGNQNIPNYLFMEQLSVAGSNTYELGGTPLPSVLPSNYANPDLQWERTTQTNIGLDFGLLDGRLTGAVDYYVKNTNNLLLQFSTAAPSAVNSQWANVGKVSNKGFELSLDGTIISNNDLNWDLQFTYSMNKNKVISLSNDRFSRDFIRTGSSTGVISYPIAGNTQIIKPGLPMNVFWGYKYTGLDEKGMETYQKDKDDNYLAQVIGNPWPDFTYGISTTLRWKRFNLAAHFVGVSGNDIYNAVAAEFSYPNILPGVNALQSALTSGVSKDQVATYSSRWIQDGSYLRLNNLTLGYSFDMKNSRFLSGARIYVTGQNLFVITKYPGFDPEVQTNTHRGGSPPVGIDYLAYPRPRTFLIGVSLKFNK